MSHSDNPIFSGSILSTFFYYAIASMLGLIAITTNSLVNGIFVGNYVGGEALASITLLIPYFTVLFAIALMFAIGGSVGAGKYIGEGDRQAASSVFSQSLLATVGTAILLGILSSVFVGPLYDLLSVPVALRPQVDEYFGVIRWVLVLQLTLMVLYYFVRADGHPILATAALVVGAVLNIALDAVFVIGLEMGLTGAAYATALSQLVQGCVLCTYFFSQSRTLHFTPRQRQWGHLFRATYNGVSEFVNEISAGLIFLLLNHLLIARLGVEGVAAFSVVNYYIYLSLMISYGIADALHLLVSQNYGARNPQRVRQFLLTALGCSLAMGVVLSSGILVFRESVTGWFLTTEDAFIAEQSANLVLFVWPLFAVNVTNVILSCYLTAIHQPGPSALIAVMRGLVLPISLLVTLYNVVERWAPRLELSDWSFMAALPIAEWLAFALALTLFWRHRPATLRLESAVSVSHP